MPKSIATRRRLLAASLIAVALLPLHPLRAQPKDFPSRPIRIVVAQAAGGLTDLWARHYGEQLTQQLGATVVVENKTGAGGVIGIDSVAKAAPDGYTLLFATTSTVMQNRVLFTKLPYNLDKDLVPIAVFPSGPLVVAVAPGVPVHNVKELLAWGKGKDLSMGSWGPGSFAQMVASLLTRSYGLNVQTVNYRGETPSWVDAASGQVQLAMGSVQGYNTVANRGVRAIAVTGPYRSPRLPEVATLQEQGIVESFVALEGGSALMAPAGTPEAIQKLLSAVVVKGAETPQAAKVRENFGVPNKPKNLAQTRADWDRDVPIWIKEAAALGIKLD